MRTLISTGALLLGLGCAAPKAPPVTAPAAPKPVPVRIPAGCAADQSGTYVHAEDPAFRYDGRDDGGTLSLRVERQGEDGGTAGPADAVIVLERTPGGFQGVTRAQVTTPTGRRCPAEFPTEVVACEDGGLVLRAAPGAQVDEACRPPPRPTPGVALEQRLVRQPAPTPQTPASRPDAGG